MMDEDDPLSFRGGANGTRSSGRRFLLLLLLFLVAAVGGFLLFLGETEDEESPPIVEAPDPPIVASEEIKSPPDEPGGLEIAHQDKLIYERLTPAGATVSSEDALDEVVMGLVAEEPLADFSSASGKDPAKPATPSASAEDSPEPAILPDSVEDSVEPADASIETETSEMETAEPEEKPELTILPDFVKDSVRLTVTSIEPETNETETSQSKEEAEPEPELSVTSSPELRSSGDYIVQLAAFMKNEEANAALKRTALKFSDAVGVNLLFVQRVDLGDRGVWHRLRVGYFATPDEAEEVCAEFQSLGQDCLVTTR